MGNDTPLPIAEAFVGTLRFAHPTVSTSVRHSLSIYGTDACAFALAKDRGTPGQEGSIFGGYSTGIPANKLAPGVDLLMGDCRHQTTTKEELKEYERWLKDFVASEEQSRKRHARSLKREQARHRRRLKRERRARAGKRAALGIARAVRSASRSTVGAIVTAQMRSRDPQWPAAHGALRQAEPLPHRHMRGSLLARVGERQGARCDAGVARDSRDRMVLGFRENAGARP